MLIVAVAVVVVDSDTKFVRHCVESCPSDDVSVSQSCLLKLQLGLSAVTSRVPFPKSQSKLRVKVRSCLVV